MTERILISGITGFAGSHLAELALKNKWIDLKKIKKNIKKMPINDYSRYLKFFLKNNY